TKTKQRIIGLLLTTGDLTDVHPRDCEELANLLREHCEPDDKHVLDYYRLREVGEIIGEDDEVNSKHNDYRATLQSEDRQNGWLRLREVSPILIGRRVEEDDTIVYRT